MTLSCERCRGTLQSHDNSEEGSKKLAKSEPKRVCFQLLYVFCLLVVLVKLSVLANWLARKTPLSMTVRGEGIILANLGRRALVTFGLMYFFVVIRVQASESRRKGSYAPPLFGSLSRERMMPQYWTKSGVSCVYIDLCLCRCSHCPSIGPSQVWVVCT